MSFLARVAADTTQSQVVRWLAFFTVLLSLALATSVFAQEDEPAPDEQAPSGPILQAADSSPIVCDPGAPGFRYVEVRGSGFDAWASQRLVGDLVNANGAPQIHWASVWVTPQGGLTLEVNLCADPFQKRPALGVGDYIVSVGQASRSPIAATTISLAPPPEPPAEGDEAAPMLTPEPLAAAGTFQHPYPMGAPGNLVDGWQLVVIGVTPDAYNDIKAAVASSLAPAADQRDFMIRVQATYLGPGTGVFGGVRLALVSGIQNTYDQIHNNCGVIPESLPPDVVTSGTTVRGNVCFTVRVSDVDSLVMLDNQSAEADRVFFSLQ